MFLIFLTNIDHKLPKGSWINANKGCWNLCHGSNLDFLVCFLVLFLYYVFKIYVFLILKGGHF